MEMHSKRAQGFVHVRKRAAVVVVFGIRTGYHPHDQKFGIQDERVDDSETIRGKLIYQVSDTEGGLVVLTFLSI